MNLYIYLRDVNTCDLSYHRERNREIIKAALESKAKADEIHLINECPDLDFEDELTIEGHQFLISCPGQFILNDLMHDDSSLNRRFGFTEADVDKKADLFIKLWEGVMKKVLAKFSWSSIDSGSVKYIVYYGDPNINEESVIYGECRGVPYFSLYFPKKVMREHYPNPENFIPGLQDAGLQQFFDFSLLTEDEATQYLIPNYYLEISERESVRTNPAKMELLTKKWMETLVTTLG